MDKINELTHFEKEILDYIDKHPTMSCVELFEAFGKGTYTLSVNDINGNSTNVVTAFGMSEELCDALKSLIGSGEIIEVPCSYLVYLFDGCFPSYPIANKIPAGGYKKQHWTPVTYDSYKNGVALLKRMVRKNKTLLEMIKNMEETHDNARN